MLNVIINASFLIVLIACWLNNLGLVQQVLLSLSTVAMFFYTHYSGVLNYRKVLKLHCKTDACWTLFKRDGFAGTYRLTESSVILGPLYFLYFQSTSENIALILANDSMTSDEKRHLRVALKVYRKQLLAVRV